MTPQQMLTLEEKEKFIRNVEVPKETDSYKPVPHGDLIDEVRMMMANKEMSFDGTTIKPNKHGTVMTANFDSMIDPNNPDLLARLTVQNSYDKSVALTFHAATCIKVCSNGAFANSEEFSYYTRKHTGKVNEEMIEKLEISMNQLQNHLTMIDSFKQKAQQKLLDTKQMSEIAGELFVKEQLINTKQMSILRGEINEPSFDDFKKGNAWSFYNHVTYALKESHPVEYAKKHKELHSFVEQNVLV